MSAAKNSEYSEYNPQPNGAGVVLNGHKCFFIET